jgi:hypothetical protein
MFEFCNNLVLTSLIPRSECHCWKFTTFHMWGPNIVQCVECAANFDLTHPGNSELTRAFNLYKRNKQKAQFMEVEDNTYFKIREERDRLLEFTKEVSTQDCNEIDGQYCLPCLAKQVLEEITNVS